MEHSCSRVGNAVNDLFVRLVLAELTLIRCHEMVWQTLCQDWVAFRNDFVDTLKRVLVYETVVFVHLCIRCREVKVRWNVAGEFKIGCMSILTDNLIESVQVFTLFI